MPLVDAGFPQEAHMRASGFFPTFVVLALVAGCAGPFAQSAEDTGTEVYVLETVDGRPLPHLHGPGSAVAARELTDGMLQLREGGRFFLDVTWRMTGPGGPRRSSRFYEGTWVRYIDSIRFEFDDGAVSTSEMVGDGIDIEIDGLLYHFVR